MMTRLFTLFRAALLALSTVSGLAAHAASPPLQPEDAFALSVAPSPDGGQTLSWRIADGYYLYRGKFQAETPEGEPIALDLPPGERHDDPYFGPEEIYRGDVAAQMAAQSGPVTLTWQGCQQDGICYAPQMARLDAEGTVSPLSPITSL